MKNSPQIPVFGEHFSPKLVFLMKNHPKMSHKCRKSTPKCVQKIRGGGPLTYEQGGEIYNTSADIALSKIKQYTKIKKMHTRVRSPAVN